MDDGDARYRPETGCAARADLRHDSLTATAPPAQRWLLIESHTPWPRQALSALEHSLADVVARLSRELGIRPVLVRRYGRVDRTRGRRWGMVDCRPGREEVRWGPLPTDEHLLDVLAGKVAGTVSTEPVYLVCTHGRHDACCAVRGRPVAAALAAAYPERTWECSHIGGDRFAANVVVLPHGLFYGHVPPTRAVELASQYDKGLVVPGLLRGSGAFTPPVQAAQHFAREAGHSPTLDNLLPQSVQQLPNQHYRVVLSTTDPATPSNATSSGSITVEVSAHLDTIDARLTCAGTSPAQIRRFELHSLTTD
ncbi:sucrase ferredoxin [Kribbella sp. NPDC049584]|uniref:sucrase ferredoxin n=1 Tax=Kribbella sp. NPDC049584 TaxID=3154833 RepID=UPI00342BB066